MADMTSRLAQLGTEPISPDAPCGVSARYETEEYDRLEAEIAKLETLTAEGNAEPVDWARVVELGTTILREKSKDLLVASYLSRGLLEQHGYDGLAAAIALYCDLLETFWDALFPAKKRMRGRIAATAWMVERLGNAVARRTPVASDHAALILCQERLERLRGLLDEHLGTEAPDLGVLSRAIREHVAATTPPDTPAQNSLPSPKVEAAPETPVEATQKPEPEAPAEPQAAATPDATPLAQEVPRPAASEASPAEPVQASPPAPAVSEPATEPSTTTRAPAAISTSFASERDVQQALRACQTSLRNAAAFWLGQRLTNPLPYRLYRLSTWMTVSQLPQHQEQVTQISRPQPEIVQGYEDALQQGHHARVIPEIEAHVTRAPFWLDAHYLTASALDALGPSHAEAKQAVVVELASFIRRLPEVVDLKFADGTPFAGEQTRAWIDTEVSAPGQATSAVRSLPMPTQRMHETVVPAPNGAPSIAWQQVMEAARQLATTGKVAAGAALFQDALRQASSQRERFIWRLQQARFCSESGVFEVAIPQLEFLQEQADRFGLDEWEPALSLEVVQLLLHCYYALVQKTKKPTPELVDKAEQLHARLCRLDVTAALVMDENG